MRIVVNAAAASSGGALTILKSFYGSVIQNYSKEVEWIFLVSDNYIEEQENVKTLVLKDIKKSWLNRLKFDFIVGKKLVNELRPDLIFSLQNTKIYGVKTEQIIYLHQPIPYQNIKKFSFFKKEERILAIYQKVIGKLIDSSLLNSKLIIVQTQWMRNAVNEKLKINIDKILVYPPDTTILTKKISGNFQNNLFFYPASKIIYKNHQIIYKAVEILNSKGYSDFKVFLTIEDNLRHPNISFIGNLKHEKVIDYFTYSTLIFPSYIETFGLPLKEAKDVGTIILASDTSFSQEILEGYENAHFFGFNNANELANLMEKVIIKEINLQEFTNVTEKKESNNSWQEIIKLLHNTAK
ncbi:glycosyltransferase [Psychrobacillus glaciei]|uniref:Glycosyltransferase n=1 Tax=Psychrobacillus glaciei TaxID=2283160 RepID=A0A5J6SKR7_9BACI|nr:glycosyltransferase [Psychrobacillus glaciei]QFF98023.1 glycosyltransferase [Psychrobacillus glaciei]